MATKMKLDLRTVLRLLAALPLTAMLASSLAATELTADNLNDQISLPPGFHIEQIASVQNARAMSLGDDGTLFVSSMVPGNVYALPDVMGKSGKVILLAEKLKMPTGVAYHNGDLFVAERNRLVRFAGIQGRLENPGEPEVIADDIPGGKLHGWKYINFGPDGRLYLTVGAPCNVCNEPDTSLILRMNPDGSGQEVFARGIRNSVGFDWHPETDVLWFTENGRDGLGDDIPPDELNSAPQPGLHFGFPFCHATNVVEPKAELAALGSCETSRPPALELGAHVAPLGVAFYTGVMLPSEYQNQLFIAEHGSWNRSKKVGYRISLVKFSSTNDPASYEAFAEGWLVDEEVRGRPVDVIVAPDDSLLVTDDRRGAVYRISYTGD